MTREELAILLENESYLTAAERIRCGEDVYRTLSELRPFVARYHDQVSFNTIATFHDVIAGRLVVEN